MWLAFAMSEVVKVCGCQANQEGTNAICLVERILWHDDDSCVIRSDRQARAASAAGDDAVQDGSKHAWVLNRSCGDPKLAFDSQ
jgi:hypothetical protein